MGKIIKLFHETKEELTRVSWPNRETVTKHTLLVIGVSLVLAIYLGAADLLFTYGLAQVITH